MPITAEDLKVTYTAVFHANAPPTVAQLSEATDLSLKTIEQAIEILKGEGLVKEDQVCVDHFAAKT